MTSIYPSVSRTQLIQRRHQLRRQRQIKSLQSIWRALFLSSLAGSLIWVTAQPNWIIRKPGQIAVDGNQLLSAQAIRSLLSLTYPQSLLRLQPDILAKDLESQAAIAEATVTRKLLPPSLNIQVKEREPVAIALYPSSNLPKSNLAAQQEQSLQGKLGLLDQQGMWISMDSYKDIQQPNQLPTLKVIGFSDRLRPYWPHIYQAINHSPVKVLEIDCQNPANLIITTELGTVHLGPYSSMLSEQLNVLDRMRELPAHIKPGEMAYIDLKNPDSPSIQMTTGKI
ncbi:MAG TPA: FtsQ-type POTRA domain-containing protein [Oculatellaceae cyanobacterium]|jgi:cell division protein FtsQ